MKRKFIFLIGASVILGMVLVLIILYFYGFNISRPSYDAEYFTPEYLSKYSSPEITLDHRLNARMLDDARYYQEVLGRKMTEREMKFFVENPYEGWKKPEIVKTGKSENMAYIVTDNNWGSFFERVNGRWVFTPEDWGANIRSFFDSFK